MDVVTYALLLKKIKTSSTSISKIEVGNTPDGHYQLVFTMADGSVNEVDLPVKPECLDLVVVDKLPVSNISPTTVYLVPVTFADGNDAYYQYMYINNKWTIIGMSGLPLATDSAPGIVQPDGTTITVDANGIISINKTGLDTYMDNNANYYIEKYMDDTNNIISETDIDSLF